MKSPHDTVSPEKRKSKNIALFPSYGFMAHKMKTLENGVCKSSHFATQNKIGLIPLYRCFGINMRLKKKKGGGGALLTNDAESGLIMLHTSVISYIKTYASLHRLPKVAVVHTQTPEHVALYTHKFLLGNFCFLTQRDAATEGHQPGTEVVTYRESKPSLLQEVSK